MDFRLGLRQFNCQMRNLLLLQLETFTFSQRPVRRPWHIWGGTLELRGYYEGTQKLYELQWGTRVEARVAKQALDTERAPAQPTGACYSRPRILETTECSKVNLHGARAGVRRDPCCSVLPGQQHPPSHFFSYLLFSITSSSLLPAMTVNSALGVAVCCCCLSAPDGYCLID